MFYKNIFLYFLSTEQEFWKYPAQCPLFTLKRAAILGQVLQPNPFNSVGESDQKIQVNPHTRAASPGYLRHVCQGWGKVIEVKDVKLLVERLAINNN